MSIPKIEETKWRGILDRHQFAAELMLANLLVVGDAFYCMNDQTEADRLMLVNNDNEKLRSLLQHHPEHEVLLKRGNKAKIDHQHECLASQRTPSREQVYSVEAAQSGSGTITADSRLHSKSKMRFIYATSLLLSVTSAALIRLTFTLNVEDNKSSLTVYHGIGGSLIGERCGRKYPANEAIDFSMINSSGEGNFTVGNNTYRVHQNPVFAGGPICSTEMSPPYISIHCGKLWWNITNSTLPTVEGPCFANTTQEESELDGDLDPDWNTRKGVPNIDGSAFGWTATANIDFIALGFTVTESYNIGSSYTCNGGPNDTVCVWYKVANTAYVGRVPDVFIPTNDCDKHSKQVLIAAPNLGNDGGGFRPTTFCIAAELAHVLEIAPKGIRVGQ
ncbi:hypothetical protein FOXYS1_7615 [Fusarium oxysporum]|uniref:Uncharacterized protein n=1 Tax=Fusarium oxysporum TaxID=5507 RepID=A0A8H5ABG6_FUSOX|nr:hypothetical protein FOXYS1_7615 [Fusarium oxysporum]